MNPPDSENSRPPVGPGTDSAAAVDLFGQPLLDSVPADAVTALGAPDAPAGIALIQLADGLARIFRPEGTGAGDASTVDAARMLGLEFSNTARQHLAAAAGLRADVPLPASLRPDPEAVATERRRLADALRSKLPLCDAYLRAVAKGGR